MRDRKVLLSVTGRVQDLADGTASDEIRMLTTGVLSGSKSKRPARRSAQIGLRPRTASTASAPSVRSMSAMCRYREASELMR